MFRNNNCNSSSNNNNNNNNETLNYFTLWACVDLI